MKIKPNVSWIGKTLIVLSLMAISFIFGISTTKTVDFDLLEQTKVNVSNVLGYPTAAEFRNVNYYHNKKTKNGGELGYICGEVLAFNKDELPDGFKRFVVKVYDPPEGITLLSFPIIEGGEDALLSEKIDDIWKMFCHNS